VSTNSALTAAIGQLMPDHLAPKELRDIAYTAIDALRGILVASFVDQDSARAWQLRGAAVVVTAYQRAERSLAG
jgi:hypothetical protein